MTELARLAPTIVGAMVLILAIGTAIWFDRTTPKVERITFPEVDAQIDERPREEAPNPLDKRRRTTRVMVYDVLRHVFGDDDDLLVGKPLTTLTDEPRGIVVARRRAQQSADT